MANRHDPVPPPDYADPDASRRLVARVAQGDIHAFETLYTTLYPELLRAAVRLVRSSSLAEDVVQDIFASVWSQRASWAIRSTVRAYLHGAVRLRAATVLRAEIGQRTLEEGEDEESSGHSEPLLQPDERLDAERLRGSLLEAIRTLPARQREALILWVRHEMTLTELGEALGISHVAARKLLHKAQATLQAIVDRAE